MDIVDKLKDLSELHLSGHLDDEEFRIAKGLLLNHTPSNVESVSPPPVQLPLPSVQRIPELTGNKYKVSSWGNNSAEKKRNIRKSMIDSGVYLFSYTGRRKEVADKIELGDMLEMYIELPKKEKDIPLLRNHPDSLGIKGEGIVCSEMKEISNEEMYSRFTEISNYEWGGPPSGGDSIAYFEVQWKEFPLTQEAKDNLAKRVSEGGKVTGNLRDFITPLSKD